MILYNEERDSPAFKQQFLKDYTPSVGMMFSEGVGAGFRDVSYMLAKSVMDMDKAENAPLLTEEDWKNSKFYDETIKWDESFTTPKARLLKERRDRERELGFLLDRAGAGGTAAFYGGALVGTVPDPVNYIPFVGILSKAKSAAVLAKLAQKGRLGRAATSAADAAIGTAAYQFFPGYGLMAERETYQVKYDMRDALTDLGLALGVGFGLGAALGPIHPKDKSYDQVNATTRGKRVTPDGEAVPDNLPPEPVNTAAQRAWDSTAPTDKVDLLRRKIAADGAGVESNVPVPRQEIELQLKQTTPEFRQWFSGSKVTSKSGAPMRLYHGSPSGDIQMFGQRNFGLFGEGYYFTTNPDVASTYAKKGTPTVYPVYLSIKNPMNMDQAVAYQRWRRMFKNDPELLAEVLPEKKPAHIKTNEDAFKDIVDWYARDNTPDYEVGEALREAFKKEGIDGLTHKGGGRVKKGSTPHRVFIAFEPDQIKFAYSEGIKDFDALDAKAAKDLEDALAEVADDIPDEVWNMPPRGPEPLPPVDDTPTKQNLKRVEAKEAEVETQLDNIELTDAEALMLAESNKEVEGTEKLMEAVRDVVPCLLTYG
jgi:hypothetical protein